MEINVEQIVENAKENFIEGYNCSQSVVLAFKDILNIDQITLAKLSSTFGGGICRLRETCGTVSGMMITLGLLQGFASSNDDKTKGEVYQKGQDLLLQFEKENKSLICRELLNKIGHDNATPTPRNEDFYKDRPCLKFVSDATRILATYIKENL